MSYFDSGFSRKPIQTSYVEIEGDYEVKITSFKEGQTKDNKRYTQVFCVVNCKNYPTVSIFLTEGNNFDGNVTAFCDTFDIKNPNDFNSWINKRGYVHILVNKKDGFTNNPIRWILDENGFVKEQVRNASNGTSQKIEAAQSTVQMKGPDGDIYGDIPF